LTDDDDDDDIRINAAGQSQWPWNSNIGLKLLDCWNHGFGSRWGHECSCVYCVLFRYRPLRRVYHLFRWVRRRVSNCVWFKNLKMRRPLPNFWLQRHRRNETVPVYWYVHLYPRCLDRLCDPFKLLSKRSTGCFLG
jgi:hypothetical protein